MTSGGNPFDTSAGLAAHLGLPDGRRHEPLADKPPPPPLDPSRRLGKPRIRRQERTAQQEAWRLAANERTARRAAAARSLGMLVTDYMALLYRLGIRR